MKRTLFPRLALETKNIDASIDNEDKKKNRFVLKLLLSGRCARNISPCATREYRRPRSACADRWTREFRGRGKREATRAEGKPRFARRKERSIGGAHHKTTIIRVRAANRDASASPRGLTITRFSVSRGLTVCRGSRD